MANIFITLPVPAGAGVGANVAVSAMGREKTITIVGVFTGSLTIEVSLDAGGAVFCPLLTFTGPSKKTFSIAARFLRVRRSGDLITGTPVVGVGSNDDGAMFASLPVPAVDGVGANVDVSALGTFNTISVGGAAFGGIVTIEISEDGVNFSQCFVFQPGGGCLSRDVVARFMRVRRVSAALGTPTVDVAAINDPVTSSSGEPGRYAIPEKWMQENIAASQTDVALNQQVSTLFPIDTKMIRAGSVTGLNTRLTTPVTVGTLTATVTIGGVATTLSIIHTAALNPSGGEATIATGVDVFAAAALIGIDITTDAGFLPITDDIEAWVEIDTD